MLKNYGRSLISKQRYLLIWEGLGALLDAHIISAPYINYITLNILHLRLYSERRAALAKVCWTVVWCFLVKPP